MNIEIHKLSPDLVEDYLNFFDTEKHSDNNDEHKCYCVCWCSDDHRSDTEKMSTAEKRRDLARQYVKNGIIEGYLAYCDSRVVGWCNANTKSKCYNCICWLRQMKKVNKEITEESKIKSVFCFTIAPDMRRKGIATQLLEYVCIDAEKDGFSYVEAYPNKEIKQIDDFEGPLAMYYKCGFIDFYELENKIVMRKQIK